MSGNPSISPVQVSRFTVDQLQASLHFASGINHPSEVHGLVNNAYNVGITCGEIRTGLLRALLLYRHWRSARLFVDSAAFSEVAFSAELGRLVVVRPLTDADWRVRFRLYRWAAAAFGRRAFVVAPDLVGDQRATLERMERYAREVRQVAELGATVIAPVQKGELAMSTMFARCAELLAIPAEQLVAGVPMKKDATGLADLADLAASLAPRARVHLLGLGPESKRFAPAIATVRSRRPDARITSDSVTLRRLVGRTNGRGGGPRVLTRHQEAARAECSHPGAVKDIAISWWRRDQRSIEDAFDVRTEALEMELG